MAKQLLLHVLANVVGKYVEGLSEENLQIGIWNGTIELHNLAVKPSALDALNLPIKIDRATVKTLKLTIPWASLTSKSVLIEIDGILLQASPLDVGSLSVEQAKMALLAAKKSKLHSVESAILASLQPAVDLQTTIKQASYFQAMATKIIDNLEVTITNVHVRYEDRSSLPHSRFSCGVTLQQLSLSTTDSSWRKRFVDGGSGDISGDTVYKLGEVHQLGLYWNHTGCQLSSGKTMQEWEQYMLALIRSADAAYESGGSSGAAGDLEPMDHLLSPDAVLSVRLEHRKLSSASLPKIDVALDSSALQFQLSDAQYGQIKALQQVFRDLEYRKVMITFRPARRPTQDPRAWWRYAFICITGRNSRRTCKLDSIAVSCRVREVYMPYCQRAFVFNAVRADLQARGKLPPQAAAAAPAEEDAVRRAVEALESDADLTTLATFRIMAARKAVLEVQRLRANPAALKKYHIDSGLVPKPAATTAAATAATGGDGGGWYGWWTGAKAADAADPVSAAATSAAPAAAAAESAASVQDQQLMENIKSKLRDADVAARSEAEEHFDFLFRFRLSSSASLSMRRASQPVVSLNVAMNAFATKKGAAIEVALQLGDVVVADMVTAGAVHRHLVAALPAAAVDEAARVSSLDALTVRDEVLEGSAPQVRLEFTLRDDRTVVRMVAMPLLVVFNEQCVHQLLLFLSTAPPKSTFASYGMAARSPLVTENMKKFSADMSLPLGWTDVLLQVHAPKFVIPAVSDDRSACCVFLDAGKLTLNGSLGPPGMQWTVLLEDVYLQLLDGFHRTVPSQARANSISSSSSSSSEAKYLLTPFTLQVKAQNVDRTRAELEVSGGISGGLQARISIAQLFRILRVLDNVTGALKADAAGDAAGDAGVDELRGQSSSRSMSVDDIVAEDDAAHSADVNKLTASFQMPSLKLVFETAEKHELELAFDELSVSLVQRPLDMTVQLQVVSMSLRDSRRPLQYQHLLYTSEADAAEEGKGDGDSSDVDDLEREDWSDSSQPQWKLLRVTYRSIASPLSPLFDVNQTEITVLSAGITVFLDEIAIESFVTVAKQLNAERRIYEANKAQLVRRKSNAATSSNGASQTRSRQRGREVATNASAAAKFGNTMIRARLTRMALYLLHAPEKRLLLACPKACAIDRAFDFVMSGLSARLSVEEAGSGGPGGSIGSVADQCDAPSSSGAHRRFTQPQRGSVSRLTASIESVEVIDCRKSSDGKHLNSRLVYVRNRCQCGPHEPELSSPQSSTVDTDAFSQLESAHAATSDNFSENYHSAKEAPAMGAADSKLDSPARVRFDSLAQSIVSFRTALQSARNSMVSKYFLHLTMVQCAASGDRDITLSLDNVAAPIAVPALESLNALLKQNLEALQRVAAAFGTDDVAGDASSPHRGAGLESDFDDAADGVSAITTDSSSPPQPPPVAGKMHVSIDVSNPLVLLMEDPADPESAAIALDCGLHVAYTQETSAAATAGGEIAGSKNRSEAVVRLKGANLFLTNMSDLQLDRFLVEPFDAEVRYEQVLVGAAPVQTDLTIVAPAAVESNLSLRSIALAQRIVQGATQKPVQSKSEATDAGSEASSLGSPLESPRSAIADAEEQWQQRQRETAAATAPRSAAKEKKSDAVRKCVIIVPSLRVDVSDDSRVKNTPLVRVEIGDVLLAAHDDVLETTSTCFLAASYFNLSNKSWEPFLEKWHPHVRYREEDAGSRLSVTATSELRLNLSGAFLSRIHDSLQAMRRVAASSGSGSAEFPSPEIPFQIQNALGIPIHIADSKTKRRILLLDGAAPVPVPPLQHKSQVDYRSFAALRTLTYPELFDIHLTDHLAEQRLPILQVPAAPSRPKHYYFKLNPAYHGSSFHRPSKRLPAQPIIEEVIENSRHNRFSFQWGDPFTSLGDPARWTDRKRKPLPYGSGPQPDKQVLPPLGWGWVESEWAVDMSGSVGVEIDSEGWEYATRGFLSFTNSHQRRTMRPLDAVRRRRWIRSRYPVALADVAEDESTLQKPLPVSWHVEVLSDESRMIHISSGVFLSNLTESALELDMVESMLAKIDKEIDMVVGVDGTAAVPIFLAAGGTFRIRPQAERGSGNAYAWSEPVAYRRKQNQTAQSFTDSFHITCARKDGVIFRAVVHLRYADGIYRVTCSPSAELYNRLPCALSVQVLGASVAEGHIIAAGAMLKHSCAAIARPSGVLMVFAVADYSGQLHMDRNTVREMVDSDGDGIPEEEFELVLTAAAGSGGGGGGQQRESGDALVLTLLVRCAANDVLQMFVFSKFLLIDKTNLWVSVRSSCVNPQTKCEMEVLRCAAKGQLNITGDAGAADDSAIWTGGDYGVTLFQPSKNGAVSLLLKSGKACLSDVSLDAFGIAKTAVDVRSREEGCCYHLALKSSPLSGAFSCTKVLTVMPSIMIVNCLDQSVDLLQVPKSGSGPAAGSFTVGAGMTRAWVSDSDRAPTTVKLRTAFSGATFGTVDLNEVGSAQLVIPRSHHDRFDRNSGLMILNVEVKLSPPSDSSYLTVMIWQAVIERMSDGSIDTSTVALSIRNQTSLPLVVRQHVSRSDSSSDSDDDSLKRYDLRLAPGQWLPYGWRDPDAGQLLWVAIGTSHKLTKMPVCEFDVIRSIGQTFAVPLPVSADGSGSSGDASSDAAVAGLDAEARAQLSALQQGDIQLKVELLGNGFDVRVFHRSVEDSVKLPARSLRNLDSMNIGALAYAASPDLQGARYFIFELAFSWVSLSLTAERPARRELLCAHLDSVDLLYMRLSDDFDYHEEINEVKVQNIQIDNFSESVLYPVLLHSYDRKEEERVHDTERERRKKALLRQDRSGDSVQILNTDSDDERDGVGGGGSSYGSFGSSSYGSEKNGDKLLPFFHIALTKAKPKVDDASHLKSLSVRMLELRLNVDSSSIILFFLDMLPDLVGESSTTGIANTSDSNSYISEYNKRVANEQAAGTGDAVLSMETAYHAALSEKKNFMERVMLHPVKIKVRFLVSAFPRRSLKAELRRQGLSWLSALQRATTIDGALIKLNAFSTSDAMVTVPQITRLIVERTVTGVRNNLAALIGSVFGSMEVLGKPAGLYKKLGSGVQDFFYEPYQGAMQSPTKFFVGIGKGTTLLATEIATGLVCSAASIVGSVSEGVSGIASAALVGDDEYIAKRAERRRQERLKNDGIGSGFKSGASNVIEGFAAGISGIVTAPLEQGKRGGALGFVKGVGMGLVGAAVKPALGLSDGVAAVAAGFNRSTDDIEERTWFRPSRAFERVHHDARLLLLVEFSDLFAAFAQQVIVERAYKGKYKDRYEASVLLRAAAERLFKYESTKTYRCVGARSTSDPAAPFGLAISSTRVFVMNVRCDVLHQVPFSAISHINLSANEDREYAVDFILYSNESSYNIPEQQQRKQQQQQNSHIRVPCGSAVDGENVFNVLLQFHTKMGNPLECTSMRRKIHSVSGIIVNGAELAPTSSSFNLGDAAAAENESHDEADDYEFGLMCNGSVVAKERGSNSQIIQRARERLAAVPFGFDHNNSTQSFEIIDSANAGAGAVLGLSKLEYYCTMDRLVWQLIADWKNNHRFILNPSRCSACLVINETPSPVQIVQVTLQEGLDYHLLSVGAGYSAETQSLLPRGGAVVVFGFGKTPSVIDLAHVRIKVFTTACILHVSTRGQGSSCKNKDGWYASFREKTVRDTWSKCVVVIN